MTNPFKKNRRLKVAVYCIIAAATFWFFNAMSNRYTTEIDFPVRYNVQGDQELISSENQILISIYGSGWNIVGNQLGFKVAPLRIQLENDGEYHISTKKYTGEIRNGLVGVELKEIITSELICNVQKSSE